MSFHDVRFPDNIAYGSVGGPSFRTSIAASDSGAESRVARWGGSGRHVYDVSYGLKSLDDVNYLRKFFIQRLGHAYGFRFKDFMDCISNDYGIATQLGGIAPSDTDTMIGVGDGTTTDFQLIKEYRSEVVVRQRTITKPVEGTVVVSLDAVPQASGWSVNTTTGVITFDTAPSMGVTVRAGFEFDVPVRFDMGADEVLRVSIDAFSSGSVPSIILKELIEESVVNDEYFFGGAYEIASASDITLSQVQARVWSVQMTAGSKSVKLPDPAQLPPGRSVFVIAAHPSSFTFAIKRHDNTTLLASMGAGTVVDIHLTVDGSSNKVWYAA